MSRVGEEETDNDNVLNAISPSLVTPRKQPIAKEKKVVTVVLSPRATKDTKINVLQGASRASTFAMQCASPAALAVPAKIVAHAFLV